LIFLGIPLLVETMFSEWTDVGVYLIITLVFDIFEAIWV